MPEVSINSPLNSSQWVPSNKFEWKAIVDFAIGLKKIYLERKIFYTLLFFIPFAFVSNVYWSDVPTFILCFLSIVPLSKVLGTATEEIALHLNQTVGSLLNATFGNAVELIISILALKDGLLRVVQTSLLGSILSNLLLVLGSSFLLGGSRYSIQEFNPTGAQMQSSMLLLALMSILIPSAYYLFGNQSSNSPDYDLEISRIAAVFILLVYILFLIFQLKTHRYLYEQGKKEEDQNSSFKFKANESIFLERMEDIKGHEDFDEEESPILAIWSSILLLAIVTALIAILSEYLVGSIVGVTEQLGIQENFIGLIVIPIVGNAAEHVTALTVAWKNKMELAVGIAVGSSIQISMFVVPLLVLLGWIIGQPLSLSFSGFETVSLFICVIIVNAIIGDGKSNWLEGIMLIAAYLILAVAFWFQN